MVNINTFDRFWGIEKDCSCTIHGMIDQIVGIVWVLCGCGFMIPIGILKAVILFIPSTIELVMIFVLYGALWLSLIFGIPAVLVSTRFLGPNLKILCLLVFLPAYVLATLILLIVSVIAYIGLIIFFPIAATFYDYDIILLYNAYWFILSMYGHRIRDISQVSKEVYDRIIKWIRDPCEHPYEIHIIEIPISVCYGFFGSIVLGMWGICNAVPFYCKTLYHVYEYKIEILKIYMAEFQCNLIYPTLIVILIIPATVLTISMPLLVAIATILMVIGTFLYGYHLTWSAYKLCYNSSSGGLPTTVSNVQGHTTVDVVAAGGFWKNSHINVWNDLKKDLEEINNYNWK